MIEITLYTVQKRVNSTKVPSGGTSIYGTLKESTSMLRPTFKLSYGSEIMGFNMVGAFGFYYWISDIVSVHDDLWLVQCTMDPLATWKQNILETNAYVTYAHSVYNLYIPDTRMVVANQRTARTTRQLIDLMNATGVYCLSTIGTDTNSNGFCNFYVMDRPAISQLADKLLGDESFLIQAKEWFSSALETVVECHWLPLNLTTTGTTVKLGTFNTNIPGGIFTGNTVETTMVLSPTWAGNYTDGEPYKSMRLFMPYVGVAELSPSDFWRDEIVIRCIVDVHTGDIVYDVGSGNIDNKIATFNGNCKCEIPVSMYKSDLGTKVSTITSGISSAAGTASSVVSSLMSGDISGAITSLASGVGNGLQNTFDTITAFNKKTPSMIGGFGGAAGARLGNSVVLVEHQAILAEPINAKINVLGLPYFRTTSLLNLTGFVQTQGASVRTTGNQEIDQAINSALDGGIYIE